jgi:hypothetical protein
MKLAHCLSATAAAVTLAFSPPTEAAFRDWLYGLFTGPAQNKGIWLCAECHVPPPGTAIAGSVLTDVIDWIKANNDQIFAQDRVQRWIPNSSITVCDGTSCVTVYYQADTVVWLPKGPSTPDQKKYKNATPQKTVTPPGLPNIAVSFFGPSPILGGQYTVVFFYPTQPAPTPVPAKTGVVTVGPLIPVDPNAPAGPTNPIDAEGSADDFSSDFGSITESESAATVETQTPSCVEIHSLLPDGRMAGDIKVGDVMILGDEETLEPRQGTVTYSARKSARGFRIVTRSGVSLVCSDTAPILTSEGLVLAPDLLGKTIATLVDTAEGAQPRWEAVEVVAEVGTIEIQHITVGDQCFWAGEQKGGYILHHNLKKDE